MGSVLGISPKKVAAKRTIYATVATWVEPQARKLEPGEFIAAGYGIVLGGQDRWQELWGAAHATSMEHAQALGVARLLREFAPTYKLNIQVHGNLVKYVGHGGYARSSSQLKGIELFAPIVGPLDRGEWRLLDFPKGSRLDAVKFAKSLAKDRTMSAAAGWRASGKVPPPLYSVFEEGRT
jgi:hypothetical protein